MPVKGVYYEVAFINHLESIFFYCAKCSLCIDQCGEQRGTYILKPLSMKGNLTAEKIENTGNIIECTDLQETTNAIKVHFLTQNALRFKVGSRHYIINFPFEYDGKKNRASREIIL